MQHELRIARLARALGTDADSSGIRVVWQDTPQQRDGNPVRGGLRGQHPFNPNTLFLDVDTSEEALAGRAGLVERRARDGAPVGRAVTVARPSSAALRRWVDAQVSAGATDEYPSSYAVIGGPLEAFADSVAATVTGDAPVREYYGSPRDNFVRSALCAAVNASPERDSVAT